MAGYPSLHLGQQNIAVAAAKAGLRRYLVHNRLAPESKENAVYGAGMQADINRFKHRENLTGGGKVFGHAAWKRLDDLGWLGPYDHFRIEKQLALIEAARKAARQTTIELVHEVGARAALAGVWIRFHDECRSTYVYHQVRPMPPGLFVPEARNELDCSSTFKLGYKEAGLEPPDGIPYRRGEGWTGTLWQAGTKVTAPRAGDAAFYGWDAQRGAPKHVACCISSAEVVSFGHTPIERYGIYYRDDLLGFRSYL